MGALKYDFGGVIRVSPSLLVKIRQGTVFVCQYDFHAFVGSTHESAVRSKSRMISVYKEKREALDKIGLRKAVKRT